MQPFWPRIWTVSISYDDNPYTTGTFQSGLCWWEVQIGNISPATSYVGERGSRLEISLQQLHMLVRGGPDWKYLSSNFICWWEVVQIGNISPATSSVGERGSILEIFFKQLHILIRGGPDWRKFHREKIIIITIFCLLLHGFTYSSSILIGRVLRG